MTEDFNRYLKRATTIGFSVGIVLVSILFVAISYFVWSESKERQIQPWLKIFPQNVLSNLVESDYHPISSKIRLIQETNLFDEFAVYDSSLAWIDGFGRSQELKPERKHATPIKDESGNTWGWYVYTRNTSEQAHYIKLISFSTVGLIVVIIVLIQVVFNSVVATKVARFSDLVSSIDSISNLIKNSPDARVEVSEYLSGNQPEFREAHLLNSSITNLIREIQHSKEKQLESMIEAEKSRTLSSVATQVAHDIRSPLEVLKSLKDDLLLLPTDSRRRVQMSVSRIEEIAFNLLRSHRQGLETSEEEKPEELLSLLQSVVLEKKIEFKARTVVITDEFNSSSYGLFSTIPRTTLKNIVSNLINNAVEAMTHSGSVCVSLFSEADFHCIQISDTGPGIPEEIRSQLFTKGFSTKSTGNGLGLYSAHQEIMARGGNLEFYTSEEGTSIRITLHKSEPPALFVSKLDLTGYDEIVILDDDPAFHEVWDKKLKSTNKKLKHYLSLQDFFSSTLELGPRTLLLSDFELMDKEYDGIDTILKFDHSKNSILVTARNEEQIIQGRCLNAGIKLLPKSLVDFVKIKVGQEEEPLNSKHQTNNTIVLIDDDRLTHWNWSHHCKERCIEFKGYNSVEEFITNASTLNLSTRIYIDSNLGNEVRGESESEKIFNLGFTNLYLSTGYEKESIIKPPWIKEIYSKSPVHIK
ncbi:MAG TPA: HAMP domain-containing sensor histidine kinase [Bacteriovoracaceae bacterium]|nr:HAMP domain-containing sensor histidine kinase [Bacteriovoracaceae bacterium]